jgi:hypothetical protein
MKRWVGFLIAIAAGIFAGVMYGWVVNPVQYVETTPDSLREDYRTDYVLMVAEAYQLEDDLAVAARRLALLGDAPAAQTVARAVQFGEQAGYAPADLDRMESLQEALRAWNPAVGVPAP